MKAVVLDMPQAWLDERRKLGLDRKDEMWDGVLHMVPPASSAHNEFGARLVTALLRLAASRGLRGFIAPGIFDPEVEAMSSYRVADLGFARPDHVSGRGIEGRAALVVEILSPSDESLDKLPFYRHVEIEELLYVDPVSRAFEVRRPAGEGWELAASDPGGWVELASLGVQLRTVAQRLQIRSSAGSTTASLDEL